MKWTLLLALALPALVSAHDEHRDTAEDARRAGWGTASDGSVNPAPAPDYSRFRTTVRPNGVVVTDLQQQVLTTPVAYRAADGSLQVECLEGIGPLGDVSATDGIDDRKQQK